MFLGEEGCRECGEEFVITKDHTRCPSCGTPIWDSEEEEREAIEYLKKEKELFLKKKSKL